MTAIPVKSVTQSTELTTTLLLGMTRARVEPFTGADWAAFAGAAAPAYMVHLHGHDLVALLATLELGHWPQQYVTVVLDANGLSLMLHSPVNCYAWHLDLAVAAQPGGDPGTEEEVFEVDPMHYPEWEALQQVSPEARQLILACPPQAQPFVLKGYLESAKPSRPHTHWLYEEETGKWVLRKRNPDGTAGPVELRASAPHELRQYCVNNNLHVLEARTPLSAFAT